MMDFLCSLMFVSSVAGEGATSVSLLARGFAFRTYKGCILQ